LIFNLTKKKTKLVICKKLQIKKLKLKQINNGRPFTIKKIKYGVNNGFFFTFSHCFFFNLII
jgi:hypothetical protein